MREHVNCGDALHLNKSTGPAVLHGSQYASSLEGGIKQQGKKWIIEMLQNLMLCSLPP